MQISLKWRELLPRSRKKEAQEKEHAPDYRKYLFKGREFLLYTAEGFGITALIAWFFYRSFWAVIPLSPLIVFFLRGMQKKLAKSRREKLALQFRDMILSAAAGLQAGYSVENAFLAAGEDVARLYGADSIMAGETAVLRRGLGNSIPLEQMLMDLGRRSGVPDVEDFAEVFSIAKRSGGAMNEMIKRSAAITGDKIEISREIRTLLASRRYEQKIMNLIPFLIVAYLQLTSGGFFDVLYGNPAGILIMTACLAVYLAAFLLSGKIVDIEV
ncbi:MAG TPA: hypothetical protein H9717_16075 [Candidatus Eisenbergiella merdipullorum]|uniref:Type II secretion system protein GspF domain-containing protein n=1 Tax=Candidatus Eisenbergiella merdipullorum TaxID=2838553 RepID=A0A9D2L1D1_9FIRM|nr:hypothetical protein [Candidatus Eisenbergiella merdipullorum]